MSNNSAVLLYKPIINPFTDKRRRKVKKKDIARLKEWIKVKDSVSVSNRVRASVGESIGESVCDSVWASVGDSVCDRVCDRVCDSVWASVRASVYESIWASVYDSVSVSVWDSIYSYISSFFVLDHWDGIEHEQGVNPFQSCIDLWESGLVPSFDGETWRLHGHKGKVLFEMGKKS